MLANAIRRLSVAVIRTAKNGIRWGVKRITQKFRKTLEVISVAMFTLFRAKLSVIRFYPFNG